MTAVTGAERILMGLGITDPKEIDLEAIAWSRGALVEYRRLDRCDATIVGSARKAVIAVNSRSGPERRRFSIGHELGHWHHHRGRILFCGNKDVDNPEDGALNPERHADTFASDLILPNYLLHPRLKKIKRLTLTAAREVGEEFAASLTATLIKVVQSNRFPLVIVCHTRNGVAGSDARTSYRVGGTRLSSSIAPPSRPTCCSMPAPSRIGLARWAPTRGSTSGTATVSRWRSNRSCYQARRCLRC